MNNKLLLQYTRINIWKQRDFQWEQTSPFEPQNIYQTTHRNGYFIFNFYVHVWVLIWCNKVYVLMIIIITIIKAEEEERENEWTNQERKKSKEKKDIKV